MSIEVLVAVGIAIGVALFLFRRRDETVAMPGGSAPGAPAGAAASVEDLITRGRKIEAIKQYREHHPVGLKEAKEAVEEIERRLRQR